MRRPVFIDTSALYGVLDAGDAVHPRAADAWRRLLDGIEQGRYSALTHNAVVVEASALVQRRLGLAGLRDLYAGLLGSVEIVWIDEAIHRRAVSALLAAGRRGVSLVDWLSFELMRERGIESAFAFDRDFANQGFALFR